MKHTINQLEDCKVELLVDVDAAPWEAAQKKAFRKLAANVSIPGFRKGKVPESMLKGRIDPYRVIETAVNDSLNTFFAQAITEAKVRPYYRPDVEVLKVNEKELSLKFTVITIPEVTLGEYKGLHAEKEVPSVNEEEVSAAIAKRLEAAADLVLVERAAKKGDTVTLDFKGYIDGVPFDGGEADNYALELGSNSFVPGFEDALVGVKAGEEKDVDITFPEQYVAELAGKPATFHCVIHEVKEKSIPELSDEAVKDLAIKEVETVEALKEFEKKQLLASKTDAANRAYYEAIVKQIVAKADVKIASRILDDEVAHREEDTKKQVESNGLTFKQYLEITGQTEEDLKKNIRAQAEETIKNQLVLQQIAIAEHMVVDNAELESELKKMADQYNMKLEDIRKALANQLEAFRDNLQQRKIQEFILANNN